MNVLIPILSPHFPTDFLTQFNSKDFVILFLPIDKSSALRGFAFATQEAAECQTKISELKKILIERNIPCVDLVEWCIDPARKIDALAQLKQCEKIILVNQTTVYFQEIFEKLKESTAYSVEVV
ncbi:MAG: hypothetical protein Q7S92_06655 [Candidatus Diapherotrites archaeon]|nr:hypothetical protein [Candidatus Diapherotrites archaeon]